MSCSFLQAQKVDLLGNKLGHERDKQSSNSEKSIFILFWTPIEKTID